MNDNINTSHRLIRRPHKPTGRVAWRGGGGDSQQTVEERRRSLFFDNQAASRLNRLADLRNLAWNSIVEGPEEEEEGKVDHGLDASQTANDRGRGGRKGRGRRQGHVNRGERRHGDMPFPEVARSRYRTALAFSKQLALPDMMVEIPGDLATSWFVCNRPDGDRVLVMSGEGRTVVRRKNGQYLGWFHAASLPRGCTILDCVLVDHRRFERLVEKAQKMEDATAIKIEKEEGEGEEGGKGKRTPLPVEDWDMYVMDVISWNDHMLADSTAETRSFFLKSRFEESDSLASRTSCHQVPFHLVPWRSSTAEELEMIYVEPTPFAKDSLLFVHKEAKYIPDLNPLYLVWRDSNLSPWAIHTCDAVGREVAKRQQVVLEVDTVGTLRTGDGLVVGVIPVDTVDAIPPWWRPRRRKTDEDDKMAEKMTSRNSLKTLIKVSIGGIDLKTCSSDGLLLDIQLEGRATKYRTAADTLSGIVHQHIMRCGAEEGSKALNFSMVVEAAATGKPGGVELPLCAVRENE